MGRGETTLFWEFVRFDGVGDFVLGVLGWKVDGEVVMVSFHFLSSNRVHTFCDLATFPIFERLIIQA